MCHYFMQGKVQLWEPSGFSNSLRLLALGISNPKAPIVGPSPIQNESSSLKNYNVNWLWIHVKTNCFQSPKTMKLTYATKGFITLVPHNASHERNYGPTSLEKHKSSLICKPFFWHQNNFNPSFLSRNKHKHFHPHKSYFSAKISQPQMALLYKER